MGITGSVGSGKTTAVGFLKEYGWQTINVDELAQEIIHENSQIQEKIKKTFGDKYFDKHGNLKRKELGSRVFSEATLLEKLDDIVWPVLIEQLKIRIEQAQRQTGSDTAVDMAVLFEAGCQSLFDYILVVMTSRENRKNRLKDQRHWSLGEIDQRMKSQLDDSFKISNADYVIWNDGTIQDLREKTVSFIQWINQQNVINKKE